MNQKRPQITVVGSINMDLVVCCDRFARPGETITASSSSEISGGKGANQAVAAALAGSDVRMVGRVGDDAFAGTLLNNLRLHDIDCDGVSETQDCPSGLAVVTVEASGQNAIMLVQGANGRVTQQDIESQRNAIETADVVLLQLEIPLDAVLATIAIAKQAGVRTILDPAPAPRVWSDELLDVDLVCPNETEAAAITGRPVETIEDANNAAQELHRRGCKNVVITLGDRGSVLYTNNTLHHFTAHKITAVDTTAAGDAFAGALGVRWAETNDLAKAVRFASAAGAIAASRHGAQPSMGTRSMIEGRGE
ncbi:Ribokinase, bacterial [Rhodopirellula maiorica SM1]|uniref:Ribokinase n=1 Tax=Rhodopirellula maiorica SM1 TaxID=1265738 RepID=M5RMY9_9BACT|nr:ribokinase [Rhodopirellula maiorica]EMI16752.1 Ribokinase, bacterial [Rhodopirellula maiorica SM1]